MTTQTTNLRAGDIRRIYDALETTFRQGDAASMDDLYVEHGTHLRTGIGAVEDNNEIRVFWREATDADPREATLDIAVVDRHGDAVIGVGYYTLTGADGVTVDQGRYIVIWKREDDRWKLHLDIWSTSQPAHAS